jgi:hypothetical protein
MAINDRDLGFSSQGSRSGQATKACAQNYDAGLSVTV